MVLQGMSQILFVKNRSDSEFFQVKACSNKAHGFHAFRWCFLSSGRTSDRSIRANGMSMKEKASGFGEITVKLGIIGESLCRSHLCQCSSEGNKQKKKKGLPKKLRQVAVAIDDSGKILAVLGGKGNASSGDSEAAFASHVSPNSIVIHDEGHFGRAFSDSTEMAVNSKGKESHAMLNPVDRVCNSVQRLFKVYLRIHLEDIQKYLDELVYKAEIYDSKAYSNYMHHIDISIFFSRISFRRRDKVTLVFIFL